MREQHHIYNFHIGFWGSLLISLVIMIQSALFLVFSAAATQAQTAPIAVTSPQGGAQLLINANVQLAAQTSTPSASPVQFTIVNTATGQAIFNVQGQTSDFMLWNESWNPVNAGQFDITATNGQFTSAPVRVTVQAAQQLVVTWVTPAVDGQVINGDLILQSTTSATVDSMMFIVAPTIAGSNPVNIAGNATDQFQKAWSGNLVFNQFTPGQYLVTARATLGGQSTDSTGLTINIQAPAALPTLDLTVPTNPIVGSVSFSARPSQSAQSVQFVLTGATGTATEGTTKNFVGVENPATNIWTALPFDTTTIANGSYSLVASATFAGQTQPVLSQNLAVTVTNVAQAAPLVIQTTGLPNGTVGTNYGGLLVATGGTLPYVWNITNGALPTGLVLQGANGTIAGIPTTAGATTLTFQVSDGQAKTATVTITITVDPAPTITQPPATNTPPVTQPPATNTPTVTQPPATTTPTAPTVTTTVSIASPAANAKITEGQVTVVVKSNVAITSPTIRLFNAAGINVLANSNARAVQDGADAKTWNYNLTVSGFGNGTYQLQAIARAEGATSDTLSQQVAINVENAPKPQSTYLGGNISAPIAGQKVSGRVLLNATINGTIKSLVFKVSTNLGTTEVPARQQAGSATIWEGSWDATSLPAGAFSVSATVETDIAQIVTLPAVQAFIVATTAPLLVAPVPANIPPAPIEQIVPPQVLQNVNTTNGTLVQTPVECQIVAIREEAACKAYLRSREIRLLSDAEQQKVKQDLGPIVTQHITVENGLAITQDQRRPVQEPLAEIIPLDKKKARDTSFLVVMSTEPPANIKPFVMQTVPAVLTLDQDSDGLPDEAEARYGTDPKNADSDGDGYNDGTEMKNGFDPLGNGVLEKPVAPMDEAILNKRPIEQPRFAGAVDKDKIKVDDVSSDTAGELALRGKSEPYAYVTLYIYSSLPIVVTVQANESGDWQYEFSHPLVDGKHDVYATVTNNTGKIVKKSEPLAFFVRGAQAVTEDEFLATSTVSDSSAQFLLYYVLAGMMIVVMGGGLFFYYLRRREHFI